MARLGLIAIAHGMWGKALWGDPIFLDGSVYPTTRFADRNEFKAEAWTGRWGYGMLWWAGEAPMYAGNVWTGPCQGAFSAMGAGAVHHSVARIQFGGGAQSQHPSRPSSER